MQRLRLPEPFRLAGAALALLLSTPTLAAPPDFAARYRVRLGSVPVGEALVQFERLEGDRYRYRSQSRSTGLTAWFYRAEIVESSEGRITDSGFRPDRYHYDRRGRGSRSAQLQFDWERNHVINRVADQRWRMQVPSDALDRLVSQLQLMEDLRRGDSELAYHVADGGLLRSYRLTITGRETLHTRLGEFETVRVVREQGEDVPQTTTFWAAPALDYLLVRLDHRKGEHAYRMVLDELNGLPISPR